MGLSGATVKYQIWQAWSVIRCFYHLHWVWKSTKCCFSINRKESFTSTTYKKEFNNKLQKLLFFIVVASITSFEFNDCFKWMFLCLYHQTIINVRICSNCDSSPVTHRLVGDDEFYHVAHRHVLCKEFSLAGQGWLVAYLRCWENNRTAWIPKKLYALFNSIQSTFLGLTWRNLFITWRANLCFIWESE